MQYFVLMPKGQLTCAKLVDEGQILNTPFTSWPLNTGKSVSFVNIRLHKLLKSFYISGTYFSGALYGLPYDQMVSLVTSYIGLCEEAMYDQLSQNVPKRNNRDRNMLIMTFCVRFAMWFITCVYLTCKFILTMLLIPFIIKLFTNKQK